MNSRDNLDILHVPQTAAVTWRLHWCAFYIPLVLSLSLFTSRGVVFLLSLFQLVIFSSV